jgi:outer membrane biosynthesis protein TonB
MKRAIATFTLPLWCLACGGGDAPARSADDATAAPAEAAPAEAAPSDAVGSAGDEAGWEGENEATEPAAAAEPGKTETRSMDVIAQIVKDNRQPVRDCFEQAKKELPDLQGDLTIHFVIDAEGKVKKAELNRERSTIKAPPLVDCAVKVVLGLKFPPSSRGMDTTVNYPYNFK